MSEKRSRRRPDIELTASVKADGLRFREVPKTEVRFFGEPGHESESGSRRTNLPEAVEPDVTYRDIQVDHRLAASDAAERDGT